MIASHKTAVITGATRGLGRELALALSADGWALVLVARTASDVRALASELEGRTAVRGVVADIADGDGRRFVADAARELGPVALLINNAGTLGPSPLPPLLETPTSALRQVHNINVVAQLALIQELCVQLTPSVTVINVSSDAGAEAYPGWGTYGASKAALDHISRVLAVENPGWRVLSVDPGDMRTAMHQAAFPGEDISDRPDPSASVPGFLALIHGDQPSGRYAARGVA